MNLMSSIIASAAILVACCTSTAVRADTLECESVRSRDGSFHKFLCVLPADEAPANCTVIDAKKGALLCDKEPEVTERKPPAFKCKWRNGKAVCQ